VANNITNVAVLNSVRSTTAGEMAISLTPGANNNNANHFTYLGVLKVELLPLPRYLPPRITDGSLYLQWSGGGILEWSPTVMGPWTPLSAPEDNYSESVLPERTVSSACACLNAWKDEFTSSRSTAGCSPTPPNPCLARRPTGKVHFCRVRHCTGLA
jgi:hypothetical protein